MADEKNEGVLARWGKGLKAKSSSLMAKVVELLRKTKKLAKDDPRRIVHSFKVGLAITLVSLFYYFEPLYDGLGASAMWAVLTVVVVFEFSVGEYILIFIVCFVVDILIVELYLLVWLK